MTDWIDLADRYEDLAAADYERGDPDAAELALADADTCRELGGTLNGRSLDR